MLLPAPRLRAETIEMIENKMGISKGSIKNIIITSEFRLLVSIPQASFRSINTVDDVDSEVFLLVDANLRAMARPTTPPPMTYSFSYSVFIPWKSKNSIYACCLQNCE